MSDNHSGHSPDEGRHDMLRANLLGLGLTSALILFLASTVPPVLMAAAVSSLSLLAAVATSAVAALLRERPLAPVLTRWDQAAALFAISLLAGFFVDAAAVEAYLESAAATA